MSELYPEFDNDPTPGTSDNPNPTEGNPQEYRAAPQAPNAEAHTVPGQPEPQTADPVYSQPYTPVSPYHVASQIPDLTHPSYHTEPNPDVYSDPQNVYQPGQLSDSGTIYDGQPETNLPPLRRQTERDEFFQRYQSVFAEPEEEPGQTYLAPIAPPRQEKHREPKKKKRGRSTALLMAACLILGSAGGFAGGYGANILFGAAGDNTAAPPPSASNVSSADVQGVDISAVAAQTAPTVVEVTTESVTKGGFLGEQVTGGAGSGVIITEDGYIATNHHVIDGASKITVRLWDGTTYGATLVGSDQASDIAVLKINASNLPAAKLGNSDTLKVGDFALAIGNPLGELGGTVTNGIISALEREVTVEGQTMTLLQTNAAINSGNSGGGLFNAQGELIGIVNAKSMGSGIEGLGFAIPINDVKDLLDDLINVGYVTGRPHLGVSLITISDAYTAMQYKVQYLGIYVESVTPNSAAAKGGIIDGDCIMEVDGTQVSTADQLASAISSKAVGDQMTLKIIRDGSTMEITVTLQEYVPTA